MCTGGVSELYFQMYNVTVRCKKGNLLASCHLAHCIASFFPHIMTIAIFCMYVYKYNLTNYDKYYFRNKKRKHFAFQLIP